MGTFDMRGQHVGQQYNAGRDMNFSGAQKAEDVVAELEKFNALLVQAKEAGILPEEVATDAQYQVTKALQQGKKPEPDKKSMIDHLTTAKELIEGVAAAGGLATTLFSAIQMVQRLFS